MKGAMRNVKFGLAVLAGAVLIAGMLSPATFAQGTDPRHNCTCDTSSSTTCTPQGYFVKLVNFSVDQNAGMSSWHYQICNQAGVVGGIDSGCYPTNVLSHAAIALPLIGDCLSPQQDVTLSQTGGFSNATLSCQVLYNDPVCVPNGTIEGRDLVAQCDLVNNTTLDGGECVDITLNIAGEMPTLGPGGALTIFQGVPDCGRSCILGPACYSCIDTPPPPDDHDCITRTKGFWGTHPHISQLFLPVTVCGETLDTVAASSCSSVTEAICVAPGKEAKKHTAYANMVSQLAAAKLNLAASASLDGSCGAAIETRIAQCEALCGASDKAISASGCIADITAFNESFDTVGGTTPPFDHPGPANPAECQESNGNGLVIGLGSCN